MDNSGHLTIPCILYTRYPLVSPACISANCTILSSPLPSYPLSVNIPWFLSYAIPSLFVE